MKIGVLGTGEVGKRIASKLVKLGHEVKMGSRTSDNKGAVLWAEEAGIKGSHGTFEDAAKHGEILFLCVTGEKAIEVLKSSGTNNLKGKVLGDITNPLDFYMTGLHYFYLILFLWVRKFKKNFLTSVL